MNRIYTFKRLIMPLLITVAALTLNCGGESLEECIENNCGESPGIFSPYWDEYVDCMNECMDRGKGLSHRTPVSPDESISDEDNVTYIIPTVANEPYDSEVDSCMQEN